MAHPLADSEGQKYTSSALSTRDDALRFACDLMREGDLQILCIENDREERVDLDEVTLWCEGCQAEESGEGPGVRLRKRGGATDSPKASALATDVVEGMDEAIRKDRKKAATKPD